MGQLETNLKNKHDRTLTRWQRLIRVNCGQSWAGRVVSHAKGMLTLANAHVIHGAQAGISDQVGFDSIVITPDMVGKRVAVFVGCEIKATKGDRLKPKQVGFRDMIVAMGGIHREVRVDWVIETGFGV